MPFQTLVWSRDTFSDGFSDLDALAAAASECDAVIDVGAHQADMVPVAMKLRLALTPGKIFISTTGGLMYGDMPDSKSVPATEESAVPSDFEVSVLEGRNEELLTCVVRPPWVYGAGGGGMGDFRWKFTLARNLGLSYWIDDGRKGAISVVHVTDLADLYALILGALS